MLKTISALLAVLIFGSNTAKAQPNLNPDTEHQVISHSTIPNVRVQRKFVNPIKLTVRHFPLHRIFADDDDYSVGATQHDMHHRREIELAVVVSDYKISDSVALRLWLIRHRALEAYQQHWG
jgi:hypothetical protein